jgi:hypothetical protein
MKLGLNQLWLILLSRKTIILVYLKIVYDLLLIHLRLGVDIYQCPIVQGGNLGLLLLGRGAPLIIGLRGVNHVVHF